MQEEAAGKRRVGRVEEVEHVFGVARRSIANQSLGKIRVFVAGGFVRDLLSGRSNKDIDLVTEGEEAEAFMDILAENLEGKVKHHRQYLTATIKLPSGNKMDVGAARSEVYESPASVPCVRLASIEEDLLRRDFSINAMAIDLTSQQIVLDPFNGQQDLQDKRIRVLHSKSFVDDPTRLVRAIRFEQRLNFVIDQDTEQLIHSAVREGYFRMVSGVRLLKELKKTFNEEKDVPSRCISRLIHFRVFAELSPVHWAEHCFPPLDLFTTLNETLLWYGGQSIATDSFDPVTCYLLALCSRIESNEAVTEVLSRLQLEDGVIDNLCKLRQEITDAFSKLNSWIVRNEEQEKEGCTNIRGKKKTKKSDIYFMLKDVVNTEGVVYMLAKVKLDEKGNDKCEEMISLYLTQMMHVTISITGEDLMKMGLAKGPRYLILLRKIIEAKINGEFTESEGELAMASTLVERERNIAAQKLAVDGKDFLQLKLPKGPVFAKILRKLKIAKLLNKVGDTKEEQVRYAIEMYEKIQAKTNNTQLT